MWDEDLACLAAEVRSLGLGGGKRGKSQSVNPPSLHPVRPGVSKLLCIPGDHRPGSLGKSFPRVSNAVGIGGLSLQGFENLARTYLLASQWAGRFHLGLPAERPTRAARIDFADS